MQDNIQNRLAELLKEAVNSLYPQKDEVKGMPIELFLATGFGDLSSNCALRLGSLTKEKPIAIATRIAETMLKEIKSRGLAECVKDIKAEGAGFINFYLQEDYFYSQVQEILRKDADFARTDIGKGKRVLLEFVSANPTGPLSVAHARQAAVGDALANILEFLGFEVSREYYLNDEGNQINILGHSVELRMKELSGEKIEFPPHCYQGDYIYDLAKRAGSAKGEIKNIAEFAAQDILSTIEHELSDFGVHFDSWYSQKHLREAGLISDVLEFLRGKGLLYEEGGALWFKSTQFQDDKDRVVVKSDGSYTYLAPDIAYHRDKYLRGFHWLINFWGPDHHGYIPRLKAAVQALGHEPASLSVIIVQLASIFREGKPIEMSTRKGQYITLQEVLDEVGKDAARFFFIMRRTSSQLSFDLETAKKQTPENPVFYVQYAFARICSIVRNSSPKESGVTLDLSVLKEKEELGLIRKLWQFPYILEVCYKTLDPYMLTVYLQELAETFHRFYDRHRVLDQGVSLTQARLALLNATRIVFATGLDLLGISKPEKM